MEFIKKNWIFILIALICVGGLGGVGFMCSGASEELRGKMEESKKVEDYLESVAKKRKKLTPENVELTQQNVEIAEKAVKAMERQVKQKYSVKMEKLNETPIAAWKRLRTQLQELQDKMDAKPVEIAPSVEFFTFKGIVNADQPPHQDDLPLIFKFYEMTKTLMEVAMDSEVESVMHLARPMGLGKREEGSYNCIPWEIDIVASPANAQKFVNSLTQVEGYLFMLKKVEMVSPDETTEAGDGITDRLVSGIASTGPAGEGGRRGSRGGRRGRGGDEPGMEPGRDEGMAERRDRKSEDSGLVEIPITRNELLVYKPKKTLWKLRFDLIEFNIADEEAAEKTE